LTHIKEYSQCVSVMLKHTVHGAVVCLLLGKTSFLYAGRTRAEGQSHVTRHLYNPERTTSDTDSVDSSWWTNTQGFATQTLNTGFRAVKFMLLHPLQTFALLGSGFATPSVLGAPVTSATAIQRANPIAPFTCPNGYPLTLQGMDTRAFMRSCKMRSLFCIPDAQIDTLVCAAYSDRTERLPESAVRIPVFSTENDPLLPPKFRPVPHSHRSRRKHKHRHGHGVRVRALPSSQPDSLPDSPPDSRVRILS
jgi:hypothetical protein